MKKAHLRRWLRRSSLQRTTKYASLLASSPPCIWTLLIGLQRAFSCWRLLSNQRGAALFAAVVAMLLLSITLASFIALSRSEVLIAQNDREAVQAFFAAEAGANVGRWMLRQRLTVDLPVQMAAAPLTPVAIETRYNSREGAVLFLVELANSAGGPNFVVCPAGQCPDPPWDRDPTTGGEIPDDQQAVLTLRSRDPSYTTRLIVSAVDNPATPEAEPVIGPGGSTGLFAYRWRIESNGTAGRARQLVNLSSQGSLLPTGVFVVVLDGTSGNFDVTTSGFGFTTYTWRQGR